MVFLPDYPLVLSPLKHKGAGAFFEKKKKKRIPNRGSSLNNGIDDIVKLIQ